MKIEQTVKKSLGQHWLNDSQTLQIICQMAKIETTDTVLEIGPGTGNLTRVILNTGAKLVALELDETLVNGLRTEFLDQANLTVEQGDIRSYNLSSLPHGYKIVANIPYYLTSYLLRLLIDADNKPFIAVLLMQKEVAERVAAGPGHMSFISLAAQLYYKISLGPVVPAKLFTPPPKVDSRALILERFDELNLNKVDVQKFLHLAKIGFAQPRKTLVNNLRAGLGTDKSVSKQMIKKADLPANIRAQGLSMQDWHNLYVQLYN